MTINLRILQRIFTNTSLVQRSELLRIYVSVTTVPRTLSTDTTGTCTTLDVKPSDALIDEPVTINVTGLIKCQKVTLSAILVNDGKKFLSCAHYTADDRGCVCCNKHPSEGGSYTGIEPMGLFWSMVQSVKHKRAVRLMKKDVTTPYNVSLSVLRDHRDLSSLDQSEGETSDTLVTTNIRRWYLAKGVRRLPVKEGRLRGALFIPPGEGPFPTVLDMFGGSGGLFDFRAALLASRGFLALSLAYLYYDGLPRHYSQVDFNYFLEATDWLSRRPMASSSGIGVVGVSFGAAMAYLLSVYCPKIKAVVAINGLPFSPLRDQYINGELIEGYVPILTGRDEKGYGQNTFAFKDGEIQVTPIWRNGVKILSLISEDDQSVDPNFHRYLMKRIPEDKNKNIQNIFYPGAGHLIEPPYTPLCPASYLGDTWDTVLKWGGEPKSHAVAQEDAWRRTLEHLNKNLAP